MIKEVKLETIDSVLEILTEQEYEKSIGRYRSSYIYRGLPNINFSLATSLARNCKSEQYNLEKCILRNFTKYATIDDPDLTKSIWRQLIIGQHHGLPTRLLDWTYSVLVALHFATSGEALSDMDKHDCVIWGIDINEINEKLPRKYKQILDQERAYLFTTDMLDKFNLEQYDSDMADNSFVLLEPPSIDQRIVNQYSYFSVIPSGIDNFEKFLNEKTNNTIKYIIDKDLKWKIRDMLDALNMNERIMFPGFDGLCKWLARHYYVK